MLTAEEIKSLKAKVKAEMSRRNGYGSLSEFGGADYDFAAEPAAGGVIAAEHGQKTVDLLLKITDIDGLVLVMKGDVIPDQVDLSLMDHVDAVSYTHLEEAIWTLRTRWQSWARWRETRSAAMMRLSLLWSS